MFGSASPDVINAGSWTPSRRTWPRPIVATNRGTFEDLKRLRENFEELERARIVLQKLNSGDGAEPGAAEKS